MSAIFLSDVHLREPEAVKTRLVVRFLQEKASQFKQIFILGDLFDVWPATTPYLVSKYEGVLKTLRDLAAAGHQVHYFEGNHDFHLGSYFKELGIRVYPDNATFKLGNYNVYIAHGDLGNPRDVPYRFLRFALRQPITKKLIEIVPQKFVDTIGQKSSALSRDYQSRKTVKEEAIRMTYRKSAEKLFTQGFDVVMMGHTHLPDDHQVEVDGRQCRYLNTGDWVRHFSYVEFDGEHFYTKNHPIREM